MGLFGPKKQYQLEGTLFTIHEVDKAKERGDIFVIKDIQNLSWNPVIENFVYVLVHLDTGVNYAYSLFGEGKASTEFWNPQSSLTVLVDADGKPLVTKI